jgi:hypothetical protein
VSTVAPLGTEIGSPLAATIEPPLPSAVDWAAIIAGGVLATAISFILITFGSAIGLSLTSPYEGSGFSLVFLGVASGLWLVWVQISSFIAGAYLTGRLRRRLHDATPHEVEVRDGCHGLLVWALGVLIGATLASSVAGSVASTGAAVVSSTTQVIGSGAAQAAASGGNPLEYATDTLFRSDNPQAPDGQAPDGNAASGPEAARILAASAAQGSITADDKAYLARLIQARTGLAQPEAEQRIDRVMATMQSAADKAKAVADKARRVGVIIAFVTAAALVVSAVAAWWAAGMGGRHRDEGTDFSHLVGWR